MNTAYIDKTAERELLPTEPASTSLNYASPGMRFTPPFDFAGAFRQAIFAIGIGLLVFGETVAWGNSRAWSDDMGAWAGVGAGLIALTIPWPGHLGRKRDER